MSELKGGVVIFRSVTGTIESMADPSESFNELGEGDEALFEIPFSELAPDERRCLVALAVLHPPGDGGDVWFAIAEIAKVAYLATAK